MKVQVTTVLIVNAVIFALIHPVAAQPACVPPPDERVLVFYDKLVPHGSWFVCEPYGWVWQPHVVLFEPEWRPYCHGGRWVWVSGDWHWHSTYEWGWAVFHYGWWVRTTAHGWIWIPGLVWAPAWVEWREFYPYRAWAPLPPRSGLRLSFGSVTTDGLSWNVTLTTEDFVCTHQDLFCSIELWRVVQPLRRVHPTPRYESPPTPIPPPQEPIRVEHPPTTSRRSEMIHSIVRQSAPSAPVSVRTDSQFSSSTSSRASSFRTGSVGAIVRSQAISTQTRTSTADSRTTASERKPETSTGTSRRLERVRELMRNH